MSAVKRVRDLAIEVVIAVAFVVGGIWYVSRPGAEATFRYAPFIGNTVVVFGFVLSWYRHCWRRLWFWTATSTILAIHIILYVLFLEPLKQIPLIYFVLFDMTEWAIIIPVLRKLIHESPQG